MGNLSALANNVVQTTPVGVIEAFAGVNAPAGWLFCDGSAVSRIQYPELFSALSTTYGSGDGSTTFNLPDLRGRVPAGKDNMGGVAANRLTSGNSGIAATSLGANGGDERLHQHTHVQNAHSHQVRVNSFAGDRQIACGPLGADGDKYSFTDSGNDASTNTALLYAANVTPTNQNTGSGNSQNVQPTLIVNYIIKAVADLPRGGWFYQNQPPVVTQLPSNPQIGEEVYHLVSGNLFQKRYDGIQWQDVGQETLNTARLSGTVSNTNLPDGAPSWLAFGRVTFPTGVSQAANINFSVPYKSEVLIQASVSGYGGPGLGRQYLAVYGVTGWTEGSYYFFNVSGDHRTLNTGGLQLTLNAGSYTVGTYILNINTDVNDQASYFFFGRKVT
jgi:microcystin-dependent protein